MQGYIYTTNVSSGGYYDDRAKGEAIVFNDLWNFGSATEVWGKVYSSSVPAGVPTPYSIILDEDE